MVASYPDLHAHMQTLIIQKARRSGQFCDVMMMSPGRGLARSPNHDQVLAKPRPGDTIITSQNQPDLPAF